MTPEEILLKADDHILTPTRGFTHKVSGVLREVELSSAFLPNQVRNVTVEGTDSKDTLQIVKNKAELNQNTVFDTNASLVFDPIHLGKIFSIDVWSQNRRFNWNWFVGMESSLANLSSRLKYSILNGALVYKETGTHNMIFTPGMVQFEDTLYTTPEVIKDMRPDINMIPPRGSMLKVFFIHRDTLDSVSDDRVIYDFDSITIFLGEGQQKEEFDSVISEEIYQQTDLTKASLEYIEIARVWVKDLLHRPPILEVNYDYRVRRPNFLNWSI